MPGIDVWIMQRFAERVVLAVLVAHNTAIRYVMPYWGYRPTEAHTCERYRDNKYRDRPGHGSFKHRYSISLEKAPSQLVNDTLCGVNGNGFPTYAGNEAHGADTGDTD